jgi:hypothetical protein
MNREPSTTRAVRSWLQDGVTRLPDRVLDRVLDEVATTAQRRHGWSVRLFVGTTVAAAVVVLAAIVTSGILPTTRNVADPPPNPPSGPRISSPLDEGPLDGGTYTIEDVFDVDLAFTVPEGWAVGAVGADHVEIWNISPPDAIRPSDGIGVGFFLIDNLFFDPCAPDDRMMDPPIGPTVDDLADGLAQARGFGASPSEATTVDGYRGLRVELDLGFYMCQYRDAHLWTTPAGWIRSAHGDQELSTLRIIDVEGVRLVIDSYAVPGAAADDRAELESIVDSIRIEPAD